MTMIGLPRTDAPIIEVDGRQYAQLPEGWPAAEDKDLEEAHASAVASEEPLITKEQWDAAVATVGDDGITDWQQKLYTWTPAEVRRLVEDWSRLAQENQALRKGMKTMQRKTRKQNQVQRRLERRLNQARAGREQLRDQAEQYKDIAAVNQSAALELSLQQLRAGETVQL